MAKDGGARGGREMVLDRASPGQRVRGSDIGGMMHPMMILARRTREVTLDRAGPGQRGQRGDTSIYTTIADKMVHTILIPVQVARRMRRVTQEGVGGVMAMVGTSVNSSAGSVIAMVGTHIVAMVAVHAIVSDAVAVVGKVVVFCGK